MLRMGPRRCWGQLRVGVLPNSQFNTYVVNRWPHHREGSDSQGLQGGGFIFEGEPSFIGAVLFTTDIRRGTADGVTTRFIVFAGILEGHWWCHIAEPPPPFSYLNLRAQSDGDQREQISLIFYDAEGQRVDDVDLSNRATRRDLVPGAVLYAAVRRVPEQTVLNATVYSLEVGAYDVGMFDSMTGLPSSAN